MGLWQQWIKNKCLKEQGDLSPNPDQTFKFNSNDADFGVDYDNVKRELFTVVWSKYTDEVMQFMNGIAQRGDQEVAALLRKLEKDVTPSQQKRPRHPAQDDELKPPEADTGHADGEGGDE